MFLRRDRTGSLVGLLLLAVAVFVSPVSAWAEGELRKPICAIDMGSNSFKRWDDDRPRLRELDIVVGEHFLVTCWPWPWNALFPLGLRVASAALTGWFRRLRRWP